MYDNIYSRIRELCKARKITVRKLEEVLGFGNSSINKWRGTVSPSIDKIIEVAKYFNVSVDYLTGLSDNPCTLTEALGDEYLSEIMGAANAMSEEERSNMLQILKLTFPNKFKKDEMVEQPTD